VYFATRIENAVAKLHFSAQCRVSFQSVLNRASQSREPVGDFALKTSSVARKKRPRFSSSLQVVVADVSIQNKIRVLDVKAKNIHFKRVKVTFMLSQ